MPEPDYKLLSLFTIIASCLILRVSVESTGYTSPDSVYYLRIANNLLNRNSVELPDSFSSFQKIALEKQTYFAVWPLGYPILIAAIGFVLNLPVFWASKLVNLIFLGLCFFLFRKINSERAYLLALPFCAFTFLEVFSFTWSEGPFIFGFLYFGFILHHYLKEFKNYLLLPLFLSCLFLFFIRYIGGFSFLVIAGLCLWFWYKRNFPVATKLLFMFFLLIFISCFYLYQNYLKSGFITGIERAFPSGESLGTFLIFLSIGLINEVFIAGNYYYRGETIGPFLGTAFFQVAIMLVIFIRFPQKHLNNSLTNNSLSCVYCTIGIFYLFILIFLRLVSAFDAFDYRLLSPFTISMYLVIMLYLTHPTRYARIAEKGIFKYVVLLFGFSLVYNLPKLFLIDLIKDWFCNL